MKTWIRPMVVEECFVSNENIANSVTACYRIACNVGGPRYNPVFDSYTYKNPSKTLIYSALFEGLFA